MYEFGNNEQTAGRARALGVQLVKAADEVITSGGIVVDQDKEHLFYLLYGWWRMVNRSAAALWLLDDAGYTVESAPIVRNILEHTYSMVWLHDAGDPALTVVEVAAQEYRQKLLANMRRTNWRIVRDADIEILPPVGVPAEGDPDHAIHVKLSGEFRMFDTLVVAYDRGDVYPVYRYLCSLSHATAFTANAYLERDGENISARGVAARAGYADVIWTTVSLTQAGVIMSPLIGGDPLKRLLNRAAADLGVEAPSFLRDQRRAPLPATA
ncbi:hypothetical protein [Sphaerisporangium album]|uniref:hypothetical protein n=1 Tax=Sphaerisporangium album TaxID=509200 RepID=UPI0011C068F8|nr:hypothetical protein [Sphaerisporangium album]